MEDPRASIEKRPVGQPFHILALSGGGFRGLYAATVLAELEERCGEPLGRRFDLICGTSIGGILALALAMEVPMAEMRELFEKRGQDIFARGVPGLRWLKTLVISKHSDKPLREALESVFGHHLLGQAKHPVLVPTVSYSKGGPQIFKSPHHPRLELDHELPIVEIALSTSAAPVFLPVAHIPDRGHYVDGGLYANAPGLLGVHEARFFFGAADEDIHVLSVGSMSCEVTANAGLWRRRGLFNWGMRLLPLMFAAQEQMVDNMLSLQLGERYHRIDAVPSREQADSLGLDTASDGAIATLKARAMASYQEALGKRAMKPFLSHHAPPAHFYHGINTKEQQQ